ncbi:DUF4352 domain-containing protein [Paractinoplanes toevensis]|uniref:Mpr protein n=1 Tax=Paractinoplanes toevensis TaxID=571911 RepID=A0A919W064_9ACTN|nr:DUF4352 domain-containing protein [Actinoplanes toevensis]GIM88834.1 Mpr protein [Actinoplanes toevensis]
MSYDPNQRPAYGQQPYGQPPVVPSQPTSPYVPQGYGQPAYPVQAHPPKKRKWPWIVLGIFVIGALGCVGLFTLVLGGTAKVAGDLDDNQKGKNAAAGVMNKPITDGKFQFTVTGMKCGVPTVGGEIGQKAQGQFCLIDVSIKNVGTAAEVFTDLSQAVYDAEGNQYSADSGASVYANADYQTFLTEINPGNTVKGKLVFDLPAGTKPASILLHESTFTEGVKIPLK